MSKPEEKTTAVETVKKDISAHVLQKIQTFKETGELTIPKDYSAENALKSAYLIISETKTSTGKFALEVCTKESVANALLKMVVLGLSPMKKQGNFIVRGDSLVFEPEYTGQIALAKRFGGLKDITANAIFEGDEFEFSVDPKTGRKKIEKHIQKLENIGSKVVKGAYAVLEMNDGTFKVEIMNIVQIKDAWNQGPMKGNSPAHKNFPDQMSCKTVISRACKLLVRGSNDSVLFVAGDNDENNNDNHDLNVQHQIKIEGNTTPIDFTPHTEVVEPKVDEPVVETTKKSDKKKADDKVEPIQPGF